jgi:hypothetical protein
MAKILWRGEEGILQGLKPAFVVDRDAKAKALAYLEPVMNFDHIQPRRMPENDLVCLVNLTSGATAGNI